MTKLFTMDEQRKYLRIPFKDKGCSFTGCDCAGLVRLVYKTELGVDLPDWRNLYSGTSIEYAEELEGAVSTVLGELCIEVPVTDKQAFDVVSFALRGHDVHVGLVIDDRYFMHIMEGKTSVCVERFDGTQWKNRLTGCFRYKPLM